MLNERVFTPEEFLGDAVDINPTIYHDLSSKSKFGVNIDYHFPPKIIDSNLAAVTASHPILAGKYLLKFVYMAFSEGVWNGAISSNKITICLSA